MTYDRAEVKRRAKAALRETRPSPRLVTLVYCLPVNVLPWVLLVTVMRPVFYLLMLTAAEVPSDMGLRYASTLGGGVILLNLFIGILLWLLTLVFSFGYTAYAMHVERGLPAGYTDLACGLGMVGRVLALQLLTALFSALWGMAAMAVLMLVVAVLGGIMYFIVSPVLVGLLSFAIVLGAVAFLLNRVLRYVLAPYILLDHPEWSALQALNESKVQMKGRRWSYCVLNLSFFCWLLLLEVIFSGIMSIGGYLLGAAVQFYVGNPLYLFSHLQMLPALMILSVAALCAAPLYLWVTPYMQCAAVGFYDAGSGFHSPGGDGGYTGPDLPIGLF